MEGWIKLHRKILECNSLRREPYTQMQAWIWLILMANHKDKTIYVNEQPKVIKAGQRYTSIENLAKEWQWSRNKVKRFLSVLESERMIDTERTNAGTTITIINYRVYQLGELADELTYEPTSEPTYEPTSEPQTRMNKNEKNEKEKSIVHSDELDKSFKELLDRYASFSHNRNGSTNAKKKYRLLCTKGSEIGGERIKLTPEQIEQAVGVYVDDMVTKKERGEWTPEWRNISTVMNNITEYLEQGGIEY